jgi:hypothetical protein
MVRVVYYCFGSAHSSVIASAIHLGRLPMDRIPTMSQLLSIADFDWTCSEMIGMLHLQGIDQDGNEVYTLGVGSEQKIVIESVKSMIRASGGDIERYLFYPALPHINRLAKFGGALSRRYGWVSIGRKICFKGIISSYAHLVAFVKQCQFQIKNGSAAHRAVSDNL